MQAGRLGWARGIRGYLGRIGGICRDAGGSGRRGDGAGRRGLDIPRRSPGICSGDSAGAGLGLCLPCLGGDAGRETAPGLVPVPVLPGLRLPVLRCRRSCCLPAWVQLPPAVVLRLCCRETAPGVRCCCRSSSICLGALLLRGSSPRLVLSSENSIWPGKIPAGRVLYAGRAKLKPAGVMSSAGCIRYLGRVLLLISGDGKQV